MEAHLTAYPLSASHLSCLIVEARLDDHHTGWDLAVRFAPQLQALEIHIWDAVFNAQGARLPLKVWSETTFPHLTSLVIAATYRPTVHLRKFLDRASAPLLTHLTISSPVGQPCDAHRLIFRSADMPQLEHVFATGSPTAIFPLLMDLQVFPCLRYLAIRVEGGLESGETMESLGVVIGMCGGLRGLALLGLSATPLMDYAVFAGQLGATEEEEGVDSRCLPNLEVLLLESGIIGFEEESDALNMLDTLAYVSPPYWRYVSSSLPGGSLQPMELRLAKTDHHCWACRSRRRPRSI